MTSTRSVTVASSTSNVALDERPGLHPRIRIGLPMRSVLALAVATAELACGVHGRSRSSKSAGRSYYSFFYDEDVGDPGWLCAGVGVVIAWLLALTTWVDFIEKQPDVHRTREIMTNVLAVMKTLELLLWWNGYVTGWIAMCVVVGDGWGAIDAVLRFPVVHGIASPFALKQFLLLVMKLVGYCYCFVDISSSKVLVFTLLLVNIISLPGLYLWALPFDDEQAQRSASSFVVDEDIARRLWRFLWDPIARRAFLVACARELWEPSLALARSSPLVTKVCIRCAPSLRRTLEGRCV